MTRARSISRSHDSRPGKAALSRRPGGVGDARTCRAPFDRRCLLPILIVACGATAYIDLGHVFGTPYHSSFSGAFVLDDDAHVINNARIRSIWPLSETLSGRRPIVDLSLAINYRFGYGNGKLSTWGFHATNLTIHLLAGLTLFGIVRRTVARGSFSDRARTAAPWLALVIALLWVVHPLQTQSITYIIQRGESLMGMFYLLTLYCVIRGADSGRFGSRILWFAAAVLSCSLGMGCKAVMVTAPLVVLLFDWVFLSKSFGDLLRRRWFLYVCLAATWGVLLACGVVRGVFDPTPGKVATVGFGYKGIAPADYLGTQFGVIAHYLKLSLWPDPLCLDYAWPVARGFGEVVVPALAVTVLLAATIWGLMRKSWLGFAGAWFFLVLAPTSSFIPIKDAAFEHRMYLPLAGVLAVVVAIAYLALRASGTRRLHGATMRRLIATAGTVIIVALLIFGTIRRNRVYHSEFAMWRDVLDKAPHNPRAHLGMGTTLFARGIEARRRKEPAKAKRALADAEAEFAEAVRIKRNYADAHYNLGNAMVENRKLSQAEDAYRQALQFRRHYPKAHYNLGNTLRRLGRPNEAIESYRNAVRQNPRYVIAYINLGNVLQRQGRYDESIESYRKALRVDSSHANVRYNLGRALRESGALQEALEEFGRALECDENHKNARRDYDALRARLNQGASRD